MGSKILHGPPLTYPMEEGTVGKYMFNALKKYVNVSSCITDPETGLTISYQQLLVNTCRLAECFTNIGYPLSTVVGICSENSVYFVYPIIASLYTGLIAAPINPNYTEREFLHIFNISQPRVMFCSKNTVSKILQLQQRNLCCIDKIIVLDGTEDTINTESLTNFINANSSSQINIDTFKTVNFNRDEQIALVVRSSGTTGLPKGVMMSHKNLLTRFMYCRDPKFGTAQHVKEGGAVLSCMPLSQVYGLATALGYITLGLHTILMQNYNNELFLESIQKYKVESAFVVPIIIRFLSTSPLVDKYDLSSVRELICSASPLSKEVLEQLTKRLNTINVRQGYGMTEIQIVTMTLLSENKIGSAGKLLPLVSAKVIDLKTKECLGPYECGELCFKGDVVMKGYMGNSEATSSVIDKDGWLYTGDVGYYDEEENFFLIDRIKELIKCNGFQVAPAELESLLLEHPHIKEAAVVGKPDEIAGELPTAFIVAQPGKTLTEDEVHNFLTGKILDHKRLSGGVKFVETIPRNSSGKILRRELRQLLEENSKS